MASLISLPAELLLHIIKHCPTSGNDTEIVERKLASTCRTLWRFFRARLLSHCCARWRYEKTLLVLRNDMTDSHGISRGYHPFVIDAMDTTTPPARNLSDSSTVGSSSQPDKSNDRDKPLYLLLKQIPFDPPGSEEEDSRLGTSSSNAPEKMIMIEGPALHISYPPSDSPYSTPSISRKGSPSISRRGSSDSLSHTPHNLRPNHTLLASSSKSFSSSPSLASCLLSSKFLQHSLQEESSSGTMIANSTVWKWECTESFMREVELATPGILLARFGCCECYGRGEVLGGSGDLATRWPNLGMEEVTIRIPCPRCRGYELAVAFSQKARNLKIKLEELYEDFNMLM